MRRLTKIHSFLAASLHCQTKKSKFCCRCLRTLTNVTHGQIFSDALLCWCWCDCSIENLILRLNLTCENWNRLKNSTLNYLILWNLILKIWWIDFRYVAINVSCKNESMLINLKKGLPSLEPLTDGHHSRVAFDTGTTTNSLPDSPSNHHSLQRFEPSII